MDEFFRSTVEFGIFAILLFYYILNSLSANPTKWSNTLKQFVEDLPTNCSSVFDHFEGLTLEGLTNKYLPSQVATIQFIRILK